MDDHRNDLVLAVGCSKYLDRPSLIERGFEPPHPRGERLLYVELVFGHEYAAWLEAVAEAAARTSGSVASSLLPNALIVNLVQGPILQDRDTAETVTFRDFMSERLREDPPPTWAKASRGR